MKTAQLGKNGPHITEIGLGSWAIGGPWQFGWGRQSDKDSEQAIIEAVDKGINWVDTAAIYGLGHSEEVVGRVLSELSEKPLIATKCGMLWDEQGNVRVSHRPETIRKECEDSLRRLKVEQIDLYQIHWPDPKTDTADSWGEMVRLKEEGKVKYIGVSNFWHEDLQICQSIHPLQSLQPPYSMVHREYAEQGIFDWCLENEVGVIAYSPMQAGLLTGRFTRETVESLDSDDWRRKSKYFKDPLFSKILQFVDELRPLSERTGHGLSAIALQYALQHKAVTAAIAGVRNSEQAEKNAAADELNLSDEDYDFIEEKYRQTVLQES